jgi:Uma2 family endonuclease
MSRASLNTYGRVFHVPRRVITLESFREWAVSDDFPQQGRISYIEDGVYVDMVPEDVETHNKIKMEVSAKLHAYVQRQDLGVLYADRTLITNKDAGLATEPDATFASWDTLKSERLKRVPLKGRPKGGKEMIGSPNWTLEILSVTSMNKDRVKLRKAYHRAGVDEYWLIDALGEKLDFQMLVRGEDDYIPVEPRDRWRRSPLFGRRLFLERIRDQIGDWAYTLHIRR